MPYPGGVYYRGEVANCEGFQLLCLLSGLLLESGSLMWLLCLPDVPKLTPVLEPLRHPFIRWEVSVGSLPGKFTAFETAKESFEPFGLSLLEPVFVLEMAFIIGGLLCFLELMCNGLKHQICCMGVSVAVPVVAGVHELAPCWRADPMLWYILEGLHETT